MQKSTQAALLSVLTIQLSIFILIEDSMLVFESVWNFDWDTFICANMVSKYYSGLLLLKGCKHSQQNKLLQNDIMTIDKQKGLRRDCVCSVEDGELEVGVSGVSCLCMITEKNLYLRFWWLGIWTGRRNIYFKDFCAIIGGFSLLKRPAPCCYASACAMFSKAFQGLKCFIANVMC